MITTIFTSNQSRHLSLIKDLSGISEKVYAVIECNTVFPGTTKDFFNKSDVMQKYFTEVLKAEKKLFGDISFLPANVVPLIIKSGDLNNLSREILSDCLKSDYYIVFGASYIKGWLVGELVEKRAVNIHMGVSPYYRGSSCNFWAMYDNNPHLVGATIHLLSKGLDSGDLLCGITPRKHKNPFEYTMSAVVSAHQIVVELLKTSLIDKLVPCSQNKGLQIRYSKNVDFTDEVVSEFLRRYEGIL